MPPGNVGFAVPGAEADVVDEDGKPVPPNVGGHLVDDVLNVDGHRIGAEEVESASVSHPAVAEAAAIGVPDPLKGETIKAFVKVRVDHVPFRCLGRGSDRTRATRTVPDRHTVELGTRRVVAPDAFRKNSGPVKPKSKASTKEVSARWKASRLMQARRPRLAVET